MPGLKVAIHGQSFKQREVLDNLAAGYKPPVSGHFNIGVLHTSADGREGHAGYAPCVPADLVRHGYDYWALGHVHNREVLHEHPHIVFPGNLQGRNIRETGSKGCTLVTVEDGHITRGRAPAGGRAALGHGGSRPDRLRIDRRCAGSGDGHRWNRRWRMPMAVRWRFACG